MILVTGANGHIGRRLIDSLVATTEVRALVRSERAAASIATPGVDVRIVDYLDLDAMTEAARGCSHLVHLVGIIRESRGQSFAAAHEGTTRAVVEAASAAGLDRIVYLSILGADEGSANACLQSRARAEAILKAGPVPSVVLRVPMVLGERDHASRALYHRARRRIDVQFRATSFEQPIYAGDVVTAIRHVLSGTVPYPQALTLNLAGPESLSRAALTRRAAEVMEVPSPAIVSLPMFLGMALAGLLELLVAEPPVTRAMLGVLDHDDQLDPAVALAALSLTLTPLDETLHRCLVENPPV